MSDARTTQKTMRACALKKRSIRQSLLAGMSAHRCGEAPLRE